MYRDRGAIFSCHLIWLILLEYHHGSFSVVQGNIKLIGPEYCLLSMIHLPPYDCN